MLQYGLRQLYRAVLGQQNIEWSTIKELQHQDACARFVVVCERQLLCDDRVLLRHYCLCGLAVHLNYRRLDARHDSAKVPQIGVAVSSNQMARPNMVGLAAP